jgi:hypothetical protein
MAIAGGAVLTLSVVLAGNSPKMAVPGHVAVARLETFGKVSQ